MLYALEEGKRVAATPGSKANCPICKEEVIAKCGDINIWHWAHKTNECDSWSEGETEWHLTWKNMIKPKYTETIIGDHRADIFNGCYIIELQNSYLSPKEIQEREVFYQKMIWVFNCTSIDVEERIKISRIYNNRYVSFRWKWKKKNLMHCKRQVYLDFGDDIMRMNTLHDSGYGSGKIMTKKEFMHLTMRAVLI